ncbi:hypothetical protein [Nocardia sp. NPDC059239]|uniref:hypothetical protein n=1 Tax=unclassified Nocardia TaxID=2637762 RepID=UPI0036CE910D
MPALDDPTAKPKRAKRISLLILGGVLGAFVLLVILGLVSQVLGLSKKDSATTGATTTIAAPAAPAATPAPTTTPVISSATAPAISSTAAAAVDCYPPRAIDDPDLAAFTAGLQLPIGVTVTHGLLSTQSDHPGKVGVHIYLCAPTARTADALRPIATDIAKALKQVPLGERTFTVYVASKDSGFNDLAKIKDPDFHLHLWNGRPSAKAELATWQVVVG